MRRWLFSSLIALALLAQGCAVDRQATQNPPAAGETPLRQAEPGGPETEVRLCVSMAAQSGNLQQAIALVEGAIAAGVVKHADWGSYLGVQRKSVKVDPGCPGTPFLLDPAGNGDPGNIKPVEKPSGYRTYVVVISEADRTRLFKELVRRTAPQEMTCLGRNCAEVASALYVTQGELQDSQFISEWLLKALGVVPTTPL